MLLFTALALTPPAVAPAAPAGPTSLQLPTVQPARLEIGSGRLGGERNTIAFSYAASGAAQTVLWVRFDATFLDPRSNERTQRSTDRKRQRSSALLRFQRRRPAKRRIPHPPSCCTPAPTPCPAA